MRKKTARMTMDIAMTVLLPMMMAYSLIGEAFHEVTGTALLVLFIVHHILNRRWYGSLRKGRYNAGAFITGSTFLADGGATASYYYGPLQPTI